MMTPAEFKFELIILMIIVVGCVFYIGSLLHKNSILETLLHNALMRERKFSDSIKGIADMIKERDQLKEEIKKT